jgi:hypothetical protein
MAASSHSATAMLDPELERLRLANPAARALPLLAAMARSDARMIHLNEIDVAVAPS